jgi:folate-binding protein YgfZ
VKTSAFLDFYRSQGLRLATRPEAPEVLAPLAFGDVPAEYAALREGCGLLDETDRGLLRASGPEANEFLHRMLSNHVRGLADGEGNRNLLLSPKGKVLFDVELAIGSAGVSLSTSPGRSEPLRAALDRYLFQERVTLAVDDAAHAPIDLVGPRAREIVERLTGTSPSERPRVRVEHEGTSVAALPVLGSAGFRLETDPARVHALRERVLELGARPVGLVARDAFRAENGWALWAVDVDENVYPQEARLEEALADDKGCFVGQEVVAKIDTYGGLNKRLMALRVGHDDPVPRGTRLLGPSSDGDDLGMVTTWAYSFALDTGIVLAYVKRRHQEVGTRFALGDGHGEAELLPLPVAVPAA